MRKFIRWYFITIILFNAKVGIFSPSYAVIPLSLVLVLYIYFIYKLLVFVIAYSYAHVTVLLAILSQPFTYQAGITISYFHRASIINTVRLIIKGCGHYDCVNRLLRGVVSMLNHYLFINGNGLDPIMKLQA